MLVICKKCDASYTDNFDSCPYCGYKEVVAEDENDGEVEEIVVDLEKHFRLNPGFDGRKKLAVLQIAFIVLSAILPFLESMFTWIVFNFQENISKRQMSLYNLMCVQRIGEIPFIFWLFIAVLLVLAACYTAQLFFKIKFLCNKAVVAVPSIALALGAIMVFAAASYTDTFTWSGAVRNVAVSSNVTAYIEIGLLLALVLSECYKQLYMPCDFEIVESSEVKKFVGGAVANDKTETVSDCEKIREETEIEQLTKYKELLDKGLINQEDYEAKKKQILKL